MFSVSVTFLFFCVSREMSSREIIQNIIKDICTSTTPFLDDALKEPVSFFYGCLWKHVSEILAAYTIRAVILDPGNRFDTECEFSKVQVERLVRISVERVLSKSVESHCVKMQVYFDTIYPLKGFLIVIDN